MQIHNLIGGGLCLIIVAGCARDPQVSPEVLAARQTINELVDVRIRQNSSGYWIELEGVSEVINTITNLTERETEVLAFVKKTLAFDMPNVSYEEQCNIAENYSDLLRIGRQIIRRSALGEKFLIDFIVDGLHKNRQLCCAISLENQRPDESSHEFETRVYFLHAMRSFYSNIQKDILSKFFEEDIMGMSSEIKDYALGRLEELIKMTPSDELRRHHPKAIRRNKRNSLIGRVPTATNQVEKGKGASHAPKK